MNLDHAYFMLGVAARIRDGVCGVSRWDSGELEFVDACLPYLAALDAATVPGDFAGVWAYEVCEPFGRHVADAIADATGITGKTATAALADIIAGAQW